jgi:hypothetical protein
MMPEAFPFHSKTLIQRIRLRFPLFHFPKSFLRHFFRFRVHPMMVMTDVSLL